MAMCRSSRTIKFLWSILDREQWGKGVSTKLEDLEDVQRSSWGETDVHSALCLCKLHHRKQLFVWMKEEMEGKSFFFAHTASYIFITFHQFVPPDCNVGHILSYEKCNKLKRKGQTPQNCHRRLQTQNVERWASQGRMMKNSLGTNVRDLASFFSPSTLKGLLYLSELPLGSEHGWVEFHGE